MNTAPRRPWIAALLALVCTGLGHLYAGSLRGAVGVFAAWLAAGMMLAAAMRSGPAATIAAGLAVAAFWTGQAVHAAGVARRPPTEPRTAASPLWLLGFYAATTLVANLVLPPVRAHIAQTIYVPSGSMIPTLQVGDYLAVASGKPHPLRGAVVLYAAPAGAPSRDPIVKRVVAVSGDTVELRDGALLVNGAEVPRQALSGPCTYATRSADAGWREEPCLSFAETFDGRAYRTYCTPSLPCGDVDRQTVPEGTVWVAGDHRDHSADSRIYGPIPESMIQGEVRWVIGSWGPTGPRWTRFGDAIR